jgi:protein gp37
VFCASLADWLDDEVPIEWLVDLLGLIRVTPNLDWLLLTKRPQNWKTRIDHAGTSLTDDMNLYKWIEAWQCGKPPENVWIGTSVEDQQRADERIPVLLSIPASVRFLSCEPLLSEVKLGLWLRLEEVTPIKIDDGRLVPIGPTVNQKCRPSEFFPEDGTQIHWVICGGESGKGARPMHPAWAQSLRDQCKAAAVAFFFKQWGEWSPSENWPEDTTIPSGELYYLDSTESDHRAMWRVGKVAAGRLLDGVKHSEFPEVLA